MYTYLNKITPTGFVECVSVFCWESHIMNEKLPLYIYIYVLWGLLLCQECLNQDCDLKMLVIIVSATQIRKANKQIQHIIWKGTGPISLYLSLTLDLSLCTSLWHWTYISVPLSDTSHIIPTLYLSLCTYLSDTKPVSLDLSLRHVSKNTP